MAFKAQIILNIDFPEAESLEQAETTLDIWLDLVSPILNNKVHWDEVDGVPVYEERGN
jgi:hypothetical protein